MVRKHTGRVKRSEQRLDAGISSPLTLEIYEEFSDWIDGLSEVENWAIDREWTRPEHIGEAIYIRATYANPDTKLTRKGSIESLKIDEKMRAEFKADRAQSWIDLYQKFDLDGDPLEGQIIPKRPSDRAARSIAGKALARLPLEFIGWLRAIANDGPTLRMLRENGVERSTLPQLWLMLFLSSCAFEPGHWVEKKINYWRKRKTRDDNGQ